MERHRTCGCSGHAARGAGATPSGEARPDGPSPVLPGEGVLVGPPLATRREFAAAAAATAAAALAAAAGRAHADEGSADAGDAGGDAGENDSGDAAQDIVTVDDEGNVHIINTFEDIIEQTVYEPVASFTLPVGCTVCADCETRAVTVQANAGARPFTVVGCLDYATGEYTTVLASPVGGSAFAPSEARCTERLIAWVEVDNATDAWAFYAAPFDGSPVDVNTPGLVKLGEGDAEWSAPQFAVWENKVVWQLMPDTSGSHTMEYSHAYLWRLGDDAGVEIYESPGRFACAPNVSAGVLTLAPRIKPDEGVYYGLVALDMDRDMEQVDQQEFPVSVRPFLATRIGDNFAFSIEANYGYGGLLGTMGYYIGPGGGPFSYVAREPSAQVSYVGGRYIVKSQLSYFVIDLIGETYARIGSASGCVDYGDYPATAGTVGQFVTYAAVKDSSTGIPNGVLVRIFSLS